MGRKLNMGNPKHLDRVMFDQYLDGVGTGIGIGVVGTLVVIGILALIF